MQYKMRYQKSHPKTLNQPAIIEPTAEPAIEPIEVKPPITFDLPSDSQ
jgi:hypothetical protein